MHLKNISSRKGVSTTCELNVLLAKYHSVAVRRLGLLQYRIKKVKCVCPVTPLVILSKQ